MTYALRYRLDSAKRTAAENAKRLGSRPELATMFPADWRAVARENAKRRFARPTVWNPPYTDSDGREWRWLERVDGSGLIVAVENATERANRNTTGYYVDAFRDESQHGVVLATRDPESPRARFFAAISDPYNDGAYRILWAPESDLDSAIRSADSEAESDAEKQREHDAAWQAGARWRDLGDEIQEARRDALAILQDRKGATGSATLCAVIREKVESLLSDIRDARAARARLVDGDGEGPSDFYRTFWNGDRGLQSAFNEGAGTVVFASANPY